MPGYNVVQDNNIKDTRAARSFLSCALFIALSCSLVVFLVLTLRIYSTMRFALAHLFYHACCPRAFILPCVLPSRSYSTMRVALAHLFYHSFCPRAFILPCLLPSRIYSTMRFALAHLFYHACYPRAFILPACCHYAFMGVAIAQNVTPMGVHCTECRIIMWIGNVD
jgi:hypothetical protein